MSRTVSLIDLSEKALHFAAIVGPGLPRLEDMLTTMAADLLIAAAETGEMAVSELAGLREEGSGDRKAETPKEADLLNPPEVCGLKMVGQSGQISRTQPHKCPTVGCGHTFQSLAVIYGRRAFAFCPTCKAMVELPVAGSGDRKEEAPSVPMTGSPPMRIELPARKAVGS